MDFQKLLEPLYILVDPSTGITNRINIDNLLIMALFCMQVVFDSSFVRQALNGGVFK